MEAVMVTPVLLMLLCFTPPSVPESAAISERGAKAEIWHPSHWVEPQPTCTPELFLAGDCMDFHVEHELGNSPELAQDDAGQPAHDAYSWAPLGSKRCLGKVTECAHAGDLSRRHIRLRHARTFVHQLEGMNDRSATVVDNKTLRMADGTNFSVASPLHNHCFLDEVGDRRCLPGLVYIGFGHAGSTSLFQALAQHPQLLSNYYIQNGLRGYETWFFDEAHQAGWGTQKTRHLYAGLFPPSPEGGQQTSYEKAPWYWQNMTIPKEMFAVVPNVTLLMFLRDPVTWLFSQLYPLRHYHGRGTKDRGKMMGQEENEDDMYDKKDIAKADEHFKKILETDKRGFKMCDRLPIALTEWLKYYPRSSLIVQLTEVFKREPVKVMREIESAMGLTPYEWRHEELNFKSGSLRYHVSKKPQISKELQTLVRNRCRRPVEEAEKLLGIDMHTTWDKALAKMNVQKVRKFKRFNPKTRKLELVEVPCGEAFKGALPCAAEPT